MLTTLVVNLSLHLVYLAKAFLIFATTIVGAFCAEPANVEVSTATPVAAENEPQKRSIVSDCDGPLVGGLVDGLHSDVHVHSDLGIGLHGHGYAPGYSTGYSGGYLASSGVVGAVGLGHVGTVGHVGGAVVASSPGYAVSTGYAPHAPVLASSVYSAPVVSHAPVIAAPAVCFTIPFIFRFVHNFGLIQFSKLFPLPTTEHRYSNTNSDKNSTSARTTSRGSTR